ncbi:hypothetical protein F2Q68_00023629 [Brassica cretica]|uniref:Protein RESISTANCE TO PHYTOPHTHORA 1, chloroplastic n=2 Tax=Brassica cretica TaxID=69181 RepID=A0A8S9IAI1_BRACR|nr:hypothetical protein F2Q68_00023629 [Brassica cretica]
MSGFFFMLPLLTPISGDDEASRSATDFAADDRRRNLWTRGGRCFVGFLDTGGGVHGKKTPVPASSLLGAGASITNGALTMLNGFKTGGAGVPCRHRVTWFMVVNKTAATFAPRASTASKNPALPGTTLYKVFEVQGYASMLVGGVLSFNLLFPSTQPDLWRLMGMWSIWMFTIPSLRARDCPAKEKEALNYLFLLIPLLNVAIPFFWKSFPLVWSADTLAFFAMYAWKLGWLERTE